MGDERGLFVVIEGLDGAGTTTQAKRLVERLGEQGHRAELHAEPTGGEIGRLIRRALKAEISLGGELREAIVALLFAADRLDHVGAAIRPALAAGTHVVSDRYLPSSLAYQSVFNDPAWVAAINRYAPAPDLTIFLDVPPEACLARIGARAEARERYEALDTLRQVDAAYRTWLSEARDQRVVVLDGCTRVEDIAEQIWSQVSDLLPIG